MNGPQYFMDAAGPAAGMLASVGWLVLVTLIITTVVTAALLFWAAVRRRGTLAEHAPADTGGGQRWILVGGVLIPGVVLGAMFVITLAQMSAFPLHETAAGDHPVDIRVIGRQWWFEAIYEDGPVNERFRVPTELHIPAGQPVTLALETYDVIHSFWVPKLHGKVDMIPGRVNYVQIQADEPGVYRGECAEYCGMQHAHMILTIVAEPPDAYAAWRQRQLQPAAAPDTDVRRLGQQLFLENACVACHRIGGTPALGSAGPDLTHVASRRRIAGGMLENNVANMSAWVTHAQSLKPGVEMPNLTMFTGPELHALVAYLRGLD